MTKRESDSREELELSPSEARAHNLAVKTAGRKSTQKTLASIVLGFEIFVVFLVGLTMFGLRVFDPPFIGLIAGGAVCLVIFVALGLMRVGRIGLILGWIIHVLYFTAGFVLVPTLFIAVVFSILWVYCVIKGGQIDRERAATMSDGE